MKLISLFHSMVRTVETAPCVDRLFLRAGIVCVVLSSIWLILAINNTAATPLIQPGGTIHEGIIGTPRFVNPTLAITRADQDMTELLYSGLFTVGRGGDIIPELAGAWTTSEDETVYTVTLRDDITFHDGTPITAADVVYTFDLIQHDMLKSPLQAKFANIGVSAIDDKTVSFVLPEAYYPFLEQLTVGIIPSHLWRTIPVEQVPFSPLNTTPVGSGPYKIDRVSFDKTGAVKKYVLIPHDGAVNTPNLSRITVSMFATQDELEVAWSKGRINTTAYLPTGQQQSDNDESMFTSRVYALFFNNNKNPVAADRSVQEALAALLRDTYVDELASTSVLTSVHDLYSTGTSSSAELASEILTAGGWTKTEQGTWQHVDGDGSTPLSLSVSTASDETFNKLAEEIVQIWSEFGVDVQLEQFTQSDLVQTVIRERSFAVLLFGIDPGVSQDYYPFLHSSQVADPGINISQYANQTIDATLETLRTTNDPATRFAETETLRTVLVTDQPIIPLRQPIVIHKNNTNVVVTLPEYGRSASDRFSLVHEWHTQPSALWSWFQD